MTCPGPKAVTKTARGISIGVVCGLGSLECTANRHSDQSWNLPFAEFGSMNNLCTATAWAAVQATY